MRERLMRLHTRWMTQVGVKPARFIYLATDGRRNWRVHASINSTDGTRQGTVWLRQYYSDRPSADAAVSKLLSELDSGDWICETNAAES